MHRSGGQVRARVRGEGEDKAVVHYLKEDINGFVKILSFFFFRWISLKRSIGRSALDRQFIRPFPACGNRTRTVLLERLCQTSGL